MILNKKIFYFCFITFILGFCVSQNLAKKEKHERRKQRKINKIQKAWPKEYSQKHYKRLTITGPINFDKITITESANVTGCAKITGSIINNLIMTGSLDAISSTFSMALITGSVAMRNCKTKDNILITGPLKSIDSTFEKLNVTGPVSCKNSTITGTLEIIGHLEACDTTMHEIEITTHDQIIFENSSVYKMLIHKNKAESFWSRSPQILEVHLKGKSTITSIEFDPMVKGAVILEGSEASVGSVKNGIIKKLK